jgi:hypothetical protein
MKLSSRQGVTLICTFVLVVLSVSLYYLRHFPATVIVGESSVVTWLSGMMLIFMAALSLTIAMRDQIHPWLLSTLFFILLALDERFMFHERLKEYIIFSLKIQSSTMYNLPVVAGALGGVAIVTLLWKHLSKSNRWLVATAAVLGGASVAIDLVEGGVVPEELLKLIAEICVVCALVKKAAG